MFSFNLTQRNIIMFKNTSIQIMLIYLFSSLLALFSTNNYAESLSELQKKSPVTISFFMTVDQGSIALVSQSAQIGTKQVLLSEINAELHQGKTLIVKSISVENMSLPFPNPESYSVVAFAQCETKSLGISGFGNSPLSTYGLQNNSVYYNPGLVVQLTSKNHGLCASSYIQSNNKARVFVHGVLLDKF